MAEMTHQDPHFDPADPEYGLTPEGSTYEHTDAHTSIIVRFLVWLAITAVLVHVGLGFMYQMMVDQAAVRQVDEIRYPLAAEQERAMPPAPRLQLEPAVEYYRFRLDESAVLNGYGWQNREAGVVHIPIAEAMRLTVERGLPSRAQDPDETVYVPGRMPNDSSSGRTVFQRRQ